MGFMKSLLGLHWGRSMVGCSWPSSGGHVFGPFAFSRFDVPATDHWLPWPCHPRGPVPELSDQGTTPGRAGSSGHYASKAAVFES